MKTKSIILEQIEQPKFVEVSGNAAAFSLAMIGCAGLSALVLFVLGLVYQPFVTILFLFGFVAMVAHSWGFK